MPTCAQQVGSIQLTAELGQTYVKGDELGFFAFGGSTCIAIFQKDSVVVDEDIISNRLDPFKLLKFPSSQTAVCWTSQALLYTFM